MYIAIVGRPNVGKSTLFNRLVGKKIALVDDQPGVTRDRREALGHVADLSFTVCDTAGVEENTKSFLANAMSQQTKMGAATADLIFFVIDAREGVTPADKQIAAWVRKLNKPVILLANKCEGKTSLANIHEAERLGLGEALAISAEHGEGWAALYEVLRPYADMSAEEDTLEEAGPARPLQLAIIGRPNAGKSTLVNKLLGEERLLTGPEPGVTRDAITIAWEHHGRPIALVDTAGMRRRSKITDTVEKIAVADTLRTIKFSEIVIIMIDAQCPLEKQDLTLAAHIAQEGRGILVAVNKWDTVTDGEALLKEIHYRLQVGFGQVRGVPVVPISAHTGYNLDRLINQAFKVYDAWNTRISTATLNRWLQDALTAHQPPLVNGRRIRIKYATQVKTRPPTFALFTTKASELPESYVRYLENNLREYIDLKGVPLRVMLRASKNPYAAS